MKYRLGIFSLISFFLIVCSSSAQFAPFAFWNRYSNFAFPTGTTTITSANYTNYVNKNWILTGTSKVFINYDQQLSIGSLSMASGTEITHLACKTNPCPKVNLYIHGNALVSAGAVIDPYGSGYLGGFSATNASVNGMTTGNTLIGGSQDRSGGSHAGYGGYAASAPTKIPGAVFDNFMQPFDYGGGGGGNNTNSRAGGGGGGVVRLIITGDLTLNGQITADGYDGDSGGSTGSGGGAGGSIWINCHKLTSTSSSIVFSAAGGSSDFTGSAGGGGGMIAIYYDSLGGTMAFDTDHFSIEGGIGNGGNGGGGSGIFYAQQSSALNGDIYFDNAGVLTVYKSTPFPQPGNITYGTISITQQADVTQLLSADNITATTTNVGTNSILRIPTNGTTGYGPWFVPGTVNLTGSPAGQILEY